MPRAVKLGILVSHPIQYFVPVYRKLAEAEGIRLTVLYRSSMGAEHYHDPGFGKTLKWDVPLLGGYHHYFLSKKHGSAGTQWSVVRTLLRNRFDVLLIHGYNNAANLMAIFVAKLMGTKVLMRGDTRLQPHHRKKGIKSLLKRIIFRWCDGFVTIGSLNRAYYAYYGVPEQRLFFSPFCVQNEQFALTPPNRQQYREIIRRNLCIDGDGLIVFFASKLIKLKRADEVIRAFSKVIDEFPTACLVIAGSGEEESCLRQLTKSLNLEQIRFVGFQNQTQLPAFYAAADLFVLPSHLESWGLVVNEALAAGLPVIVSDEVGAAPDLVEREGTGIVFPCGNVDALADAIRILLRTPRLRKQMSANGMRLIDKWSVSASAKGIASSAFAVATCNDAY